MKDQKARRTSWQQLALSSDFGGRPPLRAVAAAPPRKPTLTQTFNAASKKPHLSSAVSQGDTKKQVEALRKKMSQPRSTLEMSPIGSVNRARNPERDRKLVKTMATLTKQLAEKKKGLKETFALAQKKGQLKQSFNRSSGGMGM